NTYRRRCGRPRSRSIPTTTRTHALRGDESEDLGELGGGRDVELVVTAVRRPFVGTPTHEDGGVSEAIALEVVVRDLAHALDPQRLPGEILARAPAALGARHADRAVGHSRPVPPGMRRERVLAQWRQLPRKTAAGLHRERRGHAHVVQRSGIVVEPQQQRPDQSSRTVLVPAEARHHAVRGTHVLDLDHYALAGLIGRALGLGDHPVESRAFEAMEPFLGHRALATARREMDAARRPLERLLQPEAAPGLRAAAEVTVS